MFSLTWQLIGAAITVVFVLAVFWIGRKIENTVAPLGTSHRRK
jgi:hypothetical protein